jgi:hypothetical protein
MKLSIIIVSWNVQEDLVRCIRSIKENPPHKEFEIIVIDNASSDGTVDVLKRDFSELTVIANKGNRGFAAANNQGIQKALGQYILLLNPDTIVHYGSLDALTGFMDNHLDVGACGPKLLNADGTMQPSVRHFPTFRGALHRHTVLRNFGAFRRQYEDWQMEDFGYDRQADVDQLMGAALLIRRSAMAQTGPMDERFFMYYEEVDLCYRLKTAGWRVVFVPEATITHLGGCSSNQVPVETRMMRLTSLLKFLRKHRGKFATGIFNCVFKPAVILRDICNLVVGTVTYIFAALELNKKRREKSVAKVKNSAVLLGKYSWQLLFRI